MTRKDYQLIADVLNQHLVHWSSAKETLSDNPQKLQAAYSEIALWDLATAFSYELEKTNPRFNKALFIKACGVNQS